MGNGLSRGIFWGMCVALLIFTAAWIAGFTELTIYMKGDVSKAMVDGMGTTIAIMGILITIGWWTWFIYGFNGLMEVEANANPKFLLGRFIPLAVLLIVFTVGWVAGLVVLVYYQAQMTPGYIEGATAALAVSGLSIIAGWICWFVYGFRYIYHAEDRTFIG